MPGVGAAVAERYGAAILDALGTPPTSPALSEDRVYRALEQWRAAVAHDLAAPPYAVVPDAVLRRIATRCPDDLHALSRLPGVGPRLLAKFAAQILLIVRTRGASTLG